MVRIAFFLFLFSGVFFSCGSDRTEVFEVDNEIEFITPGGLNTIETHVFVIRNVPTFIDNALQANGLNKDQVVGTGATKAKLIGAFGSIDYDFIDDISVRAISKTDPTLNKEMFFMDRISFNHNGDLELFSSITELRDIILDSIIDIEVRIRFRRAFPTQIQHRLVFSYAVFDN